MQLYLDFEQTGQSQAARGSANGFTAYLEGIISFLSEHFLNARGRFLVRLPRKGQPSTWPTPPQMKPF